MGAELTMDRLLVVTPREVRLNFEVGKKAYAKLRLQNLMHTMPVAFKILSTAPRKYNVHPQALIIPPLGEHLLEIVMAPQNTLPDNFPYSLDKFFVRSLLIPTGKATQAELNLWFSTRKKHVFNDATLKVVFTGNQILCRLAVSGSWESVNEVMRDTNIDVQDAQGRTALVIAAAQGNSGAVRALISGKANVNIEDKNGQTALFEAVLAGHAEIVQLLLVAGAATDHRVWEGWTPLHAACAWNHGECVRLLLDAGAHMDAVDHGGRTPLHEAALAGHSKVLALLVQSGADIQRRSLDGFTALHHAAASGFEEIVELLVEKGASLSVRNLEGKTPYHLALENEHSQLLDSLNLQQILQEAARRNDSGTIAGCLSRGAAVTNKHDQHGWTALHRASFKGHIEAVKLLLKHQVEVNVMDEEGYTPLHCAVEAGQKEVVDMLLQHGADINMMIHKGSSAAALAKRMGYLGIKQFINSKAGQRGYK